jgi:hypothetical protein
MIFALYSLLVQLPATYYLLYLFMQPRFLNTYLDRSVRQNRLDTIFRRLLPPSTAESGRQGWDKNVEGRDCLTNRQTGREARGGREHVPRYPAGDSNVFSKTSSCYIKRDKPVTRGWVNRFVRKRQDLSQTGGPSKPSGSVQGRPSKNVRIGGETRDVGMMG